MKLAIMQPYFFPYIGYFQLINAVDKFVLYDDVNFINRGWVNRNYILLSGNKHLLTVPLQKASQNKKINEIDLNINKKWIDKTLKTIYNAYSKAPFYNEILQIIEGVFEENCKTIAELNKKSVLNIVDYLQINTEIIHSSSKYRNTDLKAQERIIDICLQENVTKYINPIGGIDLYKKEMFDEKSLTLNFIDTPLIKYKQFKNDFVPWLSIIDILMFNSKEEISLMLNNYITK